MALVDTKYAVWLNTDVIVPKYWLERLLSPFNDCDKVATATPFTNSGVCFSFPAFCQDNEPQMDIEIINKAFERINNFDAELNSTYGGVGFCMAINMECWKEIGSLDEIVFGKGYGEENDWCFRALKKGWKHYIVPNLYVQHFHGGSFDSQEKKKLVEEHLNILREKYPYEMNTIVSKFMKKDPWKIYRQLASILCCSNAPILLIDLKQINSDKSGAIDYRNQLIKDLVQSGHDIILAEYERCKPNEWSIKNATLPSSPEIKLKTFADIKLLFEILPLRKVIINNLAFLNDVEDAIYIICKLKDMFEFELIYKFHDYLSMCPSFFLINNKCLSCINSDIKNNCGQECLNNNKYRTVIRNDINSWRSAWKKLLEKSDEYHFFSDYTVNIVKQIYDLPETKISITEHKPLFGENYTKYTKSKITDSITIAFVGNFSEEKGAQYFVDLAKMCKRKGLNYNFVIIGQNYFKEYNCEITYIGGYDRDSLGEILTKNQVHAVIYSSINNETFSYLAQELMILEVPFVCFDNGAHSERIKKYKYPYAEISDDISAEGLYAGLSKLISKVYSIKQ